MSLFGSKRYDVMYGLCLLQGTYLGQTGQTVSLFFAILSRRPMNSGTPYVLFVLALCLFLIASLAFGLFLPMQVALMCAQWVGLLAVALGFRHVWMDTSGDWPSLSQWHTPWHLRAILVIMGVVLALWANTVGGLVSVIIPSLGEAARAYMETNRNLLMPDHIGLAIVAAVTVSINAPLCEEMLFRGAILPAQRTHNLPLWLILAINGLLFGVIHFSAIAFLPLTILGAFLAYITVRSRSIWPAILVHAIVNLCNGVILPRLAPEASQSTTTLPLTQLVPAVIVLSFICAGLWWVVRRQYLRFTDHL